MLNPGKKSKLKTTKKAYKIGKKRKLKQAHLLSFCIFNHSSQIESAIPPAQISPIFRSLTTTLSREMDGKKRNKKSPLSPPQSATPSTIKEAKKNRIIFARTKLVSSAVESCSYVQAHYFLFVFKSSPAAPRVWK